MNFAQPESVHKSQTNLSVGNNPKYHCPLLVQLYSRRCVVIMVLFYFLLVYLHPCEGVVHMFRNIAAHRPDAAFIVSPTRTVHIAAVGVFRIFLLSSRPSLSLGPCAVAPSRIRTVFVYYYIEAENQGW